jgi:hypothetical protein
MKAPTMRGPASPYRSNDGGVSITFGEVDGVSKAHVRESGASTTTVLDWDSNLNRWAGQLPCGRLLVVLPGLHMIDMAADLEIPVVHTVLR